MAEEENRCLRCGRELTEDDGQDFCRQCQNDLDAL
jgi:hypothetical protein